MATYRAVSIYHKEAGDTRGDAVAWLALLSPANKPGGRHFQAYRNKRTALLQAGLIFIELDYLHHQPPTVAVPTYPDEAESTCCRIMIIDPQPDWLHGAGHVYSIHVDERLPMLTIPLKADDVIRFDFDAPYQQTYESLFFGDEVDYRLLPHAWQRYSPDDQARILSRLLAIRQAGENIQRPAAPANPLSLEEALQRWHR